MEIPLFCSVNDPDDYLIWAQKVEDLFDCEEYSEVLMGIIGFIN